MMPQNSPPKKAQKLLGSSARAPPKAERLLGDDIPARSGTLNGNLERERRPSLSSKALALLGVTAEDVRIEKALLVMGEAPHRSASPEAPTRRGPTEEEWAEMMADSERVVVSMPTFRGPDGKAERMLGMSSTLTDQQLAWLSQRGGPDAVAAAGRRGSIPTKALQVPPARDALPPAPSSLSRFPAPPSSPQMLGATIDDVRIEKALLVMGEAPGRRVPGGAAPTFAEARRSAALRAAAAAAAALPWVVAAPLHLAGHGDLLGPAWAPALSRSEPAVAVLLDLFWVAQLLSALACARHFLSGRGADGAATLALSRAAVAAVLAKGAAAGALGWPALAAATWDLGGAALLLAWAYVF